MRPDLPGIASVTTLDNASIRDLAEVPAHLAIVGGSYVRVEFANIHPTVTELVPTLSQQLKPMT